MLLRPGGFAVPSLLYLAQAGAFPGQLAFADLWQASSSLGLLHGPVSPLVLWPVARLPVSLLGKLLIWAALVGLAPSALWLSLRRHLPHAALPLALGLAAAPAFTIAARYFGSPGVLALFWAAALGPLLRAHRQGEPRAFLLAGFWAAVAAWCHVMGALLVVSVLLAAWPWRRRRAVWAGPALAAGACVPLVWPLVSGEAGAGLEVTFATALGTALTWALVLLLGGLVPAGVGLYLHRRKEAEPAPDSAAPRWTHPAWSLTATGGLAALALSFGPGDLVPHYLLPLTFGLLLLLLPRTAPEAGRLRTIFAAILMLQVGILLAAPSSEGMTFEQAQQDADRICRAGGEPMQAPPVLDDEPVPMLVLERCPEMIAPR